VEIYKRALKEANVSAKTKCYFVDDSAVNVEAASQLGWISVHVADDPKISSAGNFQIDSVTQLPLVLPELWQ
jgi:pyrimidine and pyridine-specific 5'-nucleotidase